MEGWLRQLLCGLVIFATHLVEGITGFGSSVLALPFLTPLAGLKNSVTLLCMLNCLMAAYLVARSWRSISWKEFLFILLWVGLGLPAGLALYEYLPAQQLCVLLGAAMIVIGADGLRKSFRSKPDAAPAKRNLPMRALLFTGGIIQGAFGSGGPFVVIYAARALPEKSLFRVTLSLLWLTTNLARLAVWIIRGTVGNAADFRMLGAALPFMAAGVLLGDYLHRKVDETRFRRCVYCVLAAAGAVMLINNLARILAA